MFLINKAFDQTAFSVADNDDDDNDDDDDDDDDYDLSDYVNNRMRNKRKSTSSRAFNQTTSTEIAEINTPLGTDKRSRSLISIRRRHWSGSNSRSTSVSSAHQSAATSNHLTKSVRKSSRNINMEDREQRYYQESNIKNSRIRVPRTSALTLRLRENPTNYNSRKSMLNVSSVSNGNIYF